MITYEQYHTRSTMTSTPIGKGGKDRITITLRKDLMPLLDRFVDGEKIRNRSHAIEYILSRHLGLGIQHAVIFAGSTSKGVVHALTRVRKRPVIAYWFDELKSHGIRDVVLVIDAHGKELEEYLGDGAQWGLKLRFVRSDQAGGTAVALRVAQPYVQDQFLLIYADVLADLNLGDFVEYHHQVGTLGTVALTYKRSAEEYGVARMEGNRVMVFEEKPGKDSRHGLVNAGVYIFNRSIFDTITDSMRSLEKDVLPQLAREGHLAGYPFHGKWFDVSRPGGLERAEKEWRN